MKTTVKYVSPAKRGSVTCPDPLWEGRGIGTTPDGSENWYKDFGKYFKIIIVLLS